MKFWPSVVFAPRLNHSKHLEGVRPPPKPCCVTAAWSRTQQHKTRYPKCKHAVYFRFYQRFINAQFSLKSEYKEVCVQPLLPAYWARHVYWACLPFPKPKPPIHKSTLSVALCPI